MTDEQLLDTIHSARGNNIHRGRIAGVALNPWTIGQLRSDYPMLFEVYWGGEGSPEITVNGWEFVDSYNVPEGQVRLIPFGNLEPFRDDKGQVYLWPAFTIRTRERSAQMGAHVTPGGRLEPRSEYLDPAFNHRHAERLARTMGDVITCREAS